MLLHHIDHSVYATSRDLDELAYSYCVISCSPNPTGVFLNAVCALRICYEGLRSVLFLDARATSNIYIISMLCTVIAGSVLVCMVIGEKNSDLKRIPTVFYIFKAFL